VSPRKWPRRIEDILDAIEEIQSFVRGMSFEDFRHDTKSVKAVTADLAIIGEAVSHIPDEVMVAHPDIPWPLMKAMRNRIIHVYFDVDPEILWDTIQQDLPPLVEPLRKLKSETC